MTHIYQFNVITVKTQMGKVIKLRQSSVFLHHDPLMHANVPAALSRATGAFSQMVKND